MALDKITSQSIAPNAISVDNVANGSITASKLHDTAIADKLGYTPASAATVATQINDLIAGAPAALNTLNELAAALGNDSNYAATITTALSTKATPSDITPTNVSDKVNNSTGYFALPSGTTAQRPASPTGNMIRKNTTTGYIEFYDPSTSQWIGLGAFQATGGTVTQSGNYNLHTFTSSGNFIVSAGAKAIEVLVVAGGGGGGYQVGGGGGAGGLVYTSSTTVSPGSYTVIVGAGGNGALNSTNQGTNGSNSSFSSLTVAIGGGRGSNHELATSTPGSGGSGGGGSGNSSTQNVPGALGTAGQGNSGGTGLASNWAGGGGGGASAAGGNASPNTGGNGGSGTYFSQFTHMGSPAGWFAGGGGGSMNNQTSAGFFSNGGNGGGGKGLADNGSVQLSINRGDDGVTNTGGGGGGVRDSFQAGSNYVRAGNGGSGIVIIRYLA